MTNSPKIWFWVIMVAIALVFSVLAGRAHDRTSLHEGRFAITYTTDRFTGDSQTCTFELEKGRHPRRLIITETCEE